MYDVDGSTRDFGQRGRPPDSLAFEHGRSSPRMLDHCGPAGGQGLTPQFLDGAPVLAVQGHKCPVPAGGRHETDDRGVVDLKAVGISEIELERCDTRFHSGRDDRLRDGLGKSEVQAPVDDRRLGPRTPRCDRSHRVVATGDSHVVDYGGGAADGRCPRTAHEVIRHPYPAHRHVKVGMGVDASGNHELAARVVHLLAGKRGKPSCHCGDLPVVRSAHVGRSLAAGVYDRATSYKHDQILPFRKDRPGKGLKGRSTRRASHRRSCPVRG